MHCVVIDYVIDIVQWTESSRLHGNRRLYTMHYNTMHQDLCAQSSCLWYCLLNTSWVVFSCQTFSESFTLLFELRRHPARSTASCRYNIHKETALHLPFQATCRKNEQGFYYHNRVTANALFYACPCSNPGMGKLRPIKLFNLAHWTCSNYTNETN